MTPLFTEISNICKQNNRTVEYHIIVGILQSIRDNKELDPCVVSCMLDLLDKHFIKKIKDYEIDNFLFSRN